MTRMWNKVVVGCLLNSMCSQHGGSASLKELIVALIPRSCPAMTTKFSDVCQRVFSTKLQLRSN